MRGQTTVIAAQPGGHKSGMALYMCDRMDVNVLYVSGDSDATTMIARLAAIRTGSPVSQVRTNLETHPGYYEDILADSKIRFVFDATPTLTTIQHNLDAYVELFDAWPDVVVIDNLRDVSYTSGSATSEYGDWRALMLEFKTLTRETGVAALVLHHTLESGTDPTKPSSRKFLDGKISQTPEMVLSLGFDPAVDELYVSVVKNRSGRADATASTWCTVGVLPESSSFFSKEPVSVY